MKSRFIQPRNHAEPRWPANRKKVRGWPRRIADLEALKRSSLQLDVNHLLEQRYERVKLYIDPFFRLAKRNPPWWYRLRCMDALIEIAKAWNSQAESLDQPVTVEVWLGHPRFMSSQVVAAVGERVDRYDALLPPIPDGPLLPHEFRSPGDRLDELEWKPALEMGLNDDEEEVPIGMMWRGSFKT